MADTGPTEEETPDGLLGWCLVANVARETAHGESGLDIQRGTKHFPAGALLWIPPVPWDPGHRRWPAVGRHRGNGRRYVSMVVRAEDLENFRVKGVYSEGLVRSLNGVLHDPAAPRTLRNPWSRERAQATADSWNQSRELVRIDGHSHPWTGGGVRLRDLIGTFERASGEVDAAGGELRDVPQGNGASTSHEPNSKP